MLDPAPARMLPDELLMACDFISPNETEAEILTGIKIEKIEDAKKGIFRPIDKFTYGAKQPKSVNISRDPYFRASETIEDVKEKAKSNPGHTSNFFWEKENTQENKTLSFSKTIKSQKSKKKNKRYHKKLRQRNRLAWVMKKRLFLAIPLTEEIKSELDKYKNEMGLEGVRWIPSENLHVTLYFLGDV